MANINRLLNIALRGGTLAAKFGLLAVLAILLPPEDVGYYGLLTATIGWTMYLVGWEFYTFSMRDIIARGSSDIRQIVRDQSVLYGLTYLLVSPIVLLVFATGILPVHYAFWFALLLVLEHLGLEIGRTLLALSRPLLAGFMLFLRGGAWCIVVAGALAVFPSLRHLDFVFACWTAGSTAGLVVGLASLWRMSGEQAFGAISWRWIARGLGVALPMMLASLAVRGIFTIDRFWVEAIGGAGVLGAYVLFVGVATAVLSFVDAGIVDFAYPRVIRAARSGAAADFSREMRRLGWSVGAAVLLLSLVCWLGFTLFIGFLPNPIYAQNAGLLPPIILAIAFYGISTVPHVGLYAHGRDLIIVASQLVGLAVFVLTMVTAQSAMGVAVVPVALLAAFGVILLWKSLAYLVLRRELRGK
ncbi:MAG: lipopolysaccharide biosynthesis protein [Devosia sp.]